MRHIVDIRTRERRENYELFLGLQNPTISITSEVEYSGTKTRTKATGESFFLHYLYAVLRTIDEVREFQFHIDSEGQVIYLDIVDVLIPIKAAGNGRSLIVRPPWHPDFKTLHIEAKAIISRINPDKDPYEAEETGGSDLLDVVLLSTTPDLHFTSLTCIQEHRHGSNYSLMSAGKIAIRDGVLMMPIAVTIHHGFIGEHHLSLFYKKMEEFLK